MPQPLLYTKYMNGPQTFTKAYMQEKIILLKKFIYNKIQWSVENFLIFSGCVLPQIEDPEKPGACCEAHAQGDGTQCACLSPQINDPDNNGKCCNPDSDDPTKCAKGKSFF